MWVLSTSQSPLRSCTCFSRDFSWIAVLSGMYLLLSFLLCPQTSSPALLFVLFPLPCPVAQFVHSSVFLPRLHFFCISANPLSSISKHAPSCAPLCTFSAGVSCPLQLNFFLYYVFLEVSYDFLIIFSFIVKWVHTAFCGAHWKRLHPTEGSSSHTVESYSQSSDMKPLPLRPNTVL